MNVEQLTVVSKADGLALSALLARPEGEIRGLVQIAHGMAEYKERYLPFIDALAQAGYACLIADHRGHGASAAAREDLGWFGEAGADGLVRDMRQWTDLLKARYPGLALCLFGHSMGSLAVRAYAKAYGDAPDALVISGCPSENPAASMGLIVVRALKRLKGARCRSKFVDGLVNGAFAKRFAGENSRFAWINSDPEAVAAYERDENCGFLFTLNGYEALLTLMIQAYDLRGWDARRPRTPVLFLSGGDDPCMIDREKLEQAAQKMRRAGYLDVRVKVYEGMRHEILQEPGRAEVFRDVIDFLGTMAV